MFNRLGSLGLLRDATVLDLFAGSGALGIEALSRGAAAVTFVDHDANAVLAIETNLTSLGLVGLVHRMTADRFLQRNEAEFDLAILDPPYEFAGWGQLLDELPARTALIESGDVIDLPVSWDELRSSRYGRAYVVVIKRVTQSTETD